MENERSARPSSTQTQRLMRALLIDDSKTIRAMIRGMLQQLGFDVVEAGDGLEGLDRLREVGRVDVALVDWNASS